MTSVKKIAKVGEDASTKEMLDVIENMKQSHSDLHTLSKLATAHHAASQKYIETGKAMVDHLVKISLGMDSRVEDVAAVLTQISSLEKSIFLSFDDLNTTVLEQLSTSLSRALDAEKKAIAQFEKSFNAQQQQLFNDLRKAEKESQKAGKKSPQALQAAIQAITDKMTEIKDVRKERLKNILLMERKKHTDLLAAWVAMVDAQNSAYSGAHSTLAGQRDQWAAVSQQSTKLHEKSEALLNDVGSKERTATSIGEMGEGSYDEGDEGYYDEGEGYYEEGDAYAEAAGTFTARALYDYAGTHDYELKFSAGDIITVTNVDEATGWWTGELHGVVGPFPGNYVEALE
eukprot:TRINITY_DN16716_c0_g1_i1.p1 TRINITY_DN16716_c0_g1~~TRINITY_DN16716_c0_g1_i1.p1  ORF type:complete len:344 (-),score=139.53 TRINITY_DN16716_c0_g1_i1:19-1050(-)